MTTKKFEFLLSAKTRGFSTVNKATGGLKAFHRELAASQKAAVALEGGLAGITSRFSALFGSLSVSLLTKSIWDAGIAAQSLKNAFVSITGSSKLAGEEIDFVRKTADQLGLDFQSTIGAYKALAAAAKGTDLQGKPIREFFIGISQASTVLGASADEVSRALAQVSQGISRGKFELEDLKTIAEALPGVGFQDFAQSLGVTTEEFTKMISKGEVFANKFLPALAKQLQSKFGGEAVKASDSAMAALNRFHNSWYSLREGIANSGFLDMATGKINDLTAAMNDPETKTRIIELTNSFFNLAESVLTFTANHAEAIAKVAGGMVALSALSKTIHAITGIWKGLNAMMVFTTGLNIASWLQTAVAGLSNVKVAAAGLKGVMGALAGVFLAWEVGFKIGEILNKFDTVKKFGISLVSTLMQGFLQVKKAWAWISGGDVSAIQAEIDQAKTIFAEMYAEVGNKAQKAAAIQKASLKEVAQTSEEVAAKQKNANATALSAMENRYKEYVSKVKDLQDTIAGKERSLAEELRSMARSGMSDLAAWKDRKKEADEYAAAAQKAFEAGNPKEAAVFVAKSADAYKELNRVVKDGEQTVISKQKAVEIASAGLRSIRQLEINDLKAQEKATSTLADEQKRLIDAAKDNVYTGQAAAVQTAVDKTQELNDQVIKVGKTWQNVTEDTKNAWLETAQKAGTAFDKMTVDRVIEVYIQEKNVGNVTASVRKYAEGGQVWPLLNKWRGMSRGGDLSGFGGGDRIKALLEAGEFVVKKEAVKKYGVGLFQALNTMQLHSVDTLKARLGGLISPTSSEPIRLQKGGLVPGYATNANSNNNWNLTVNFKGNVGAGGRSRQEMRLLAAQILEECKKMHRGRS